MAYLHINSKLHFISRMQREMQLFTIKSCSIFEVYGIKRMSLLELGAYISMVFNLMGMQLLRSGLWPCERLLRLDWHGLKVGKDHTLGRRRLQGDGGK